MGKTVKDVTSANKFYFHFSQALLLDSQNPRIQEKISEGVSIIQEIADELPLANIELAHCLAIGFGIERDIEKAITILESMLKNKDKMTEVLINIVKSSLGRFLVWYGDLDHAIPYTEEAATAGDARAMLDLAYFYEYGFGVDVNLKRAEQILVELVRKSPAWTFSLKTAS